MNGPPPAAVPPAAPLWSVIVIAYNEQDYLPALLESLAGQRGGPSFEVIMVDSASTDGTREVALAFARRFERFELVELPAARGPGHARNQGAARARGERLLFLDADTRLPGSFLAAAQRALARRPAEVATGLMQVNEADRLARAGAAVFNGLLVLSRPFYTAAYGACLFSTRAVHEAIGGFREDLAICEDCDYVRRAKRFAGARFRILNVRFGTSARRAEREGSLRIAAKYARVHLYRLITGREIPAGKLSYEYGNYDRNRTRP